MAVWKVVFLDQLTYTHLSKLGSVFGPSELLGYKQKATLFHLHLSLKINPVGDILLLFVDENSSVP